MPTHVSPGKRVSKKLVKPCHLMPRDDKNCDKKMRQTMLFEYKSNCSSIVHQTTAEHCNYQSNRCLCSRHSTGSQCRLSLGQKGRGRQKEEAGTGSFQGTEERHRIG